MLSDIALNSHLSTIPLSLVELYIIISIYLFSISRFCYILIYNINIISLIMTIIGVAITLI